MVGLRSKSGGGTPGDAGVTVMGMGVRRSSSCSLRLMEGEVAFVTTRAMEAGCCVRREAVEEGRGVSSETLRLSMDLRAEAWLESDTHKSA